MKKTLPALLTHVILILALIIGIGVLGIIATGMDAEGNEKFTGDLERNITLRILEKRYG